MVICHHHRDPDASPSGPELVENCLVRLDYGFKLFVSVHEGEFPETESITHDDQLGVDAFSFQSLQKCDELGGVIAMLQLAVTPHVQVADEVIFLRHALNPRRGRCRAWLSKHADALGGSVARPAIPFVAFWLRSFGGR